MPVSTFRPRLMGAAFAFLLPVFGNCVARGERGARA